MPEPEGRFEVLQRVSATEAEIVELARDRLLLREVLLKRPGPGVAAALRKRSVREQALREARALAQIRHPAVVQVIDVALEGDDVALVMETVEGESLADRMWREGLLSAEEVVRLGVELAAALEAVHAAGVVHRGLGPESVVLRPDGGASLGGFHFVKTRGGIDETRGTTLIYDRRTLTYTAGGIERPMRPPHPAPEQLAGRAADERSDVFGLGWLLYECLTGEDPFEEEDSVHWKRPRDPRKLASGVPRELGRVLLGALSPDPARRTASAAELRAALERVAAEPAAGGRPAWVLPAGGLAAVAVLALGWVGLGRWRAPEAGAAAGGRGVELAPEASGLGLAPSYARSYALLLGVGTAYAPIGFPALPNAEGDVAVLAERLRGIEGGGWEVDELVGADCTREALLQSLGALAERTRPDDRVFLYYAGHGEAHPRSPRSGWIVPADAKPLDQDPGRSSWVRFDEFFHFFQEARAKHVLVAMDCCYGGRLTTARSAAAPAFRETFLTRQAHVVLASGRPSERVSDGLPGERSPFAGALLAALEGPGPLTSSMLFASIQRIFLADGVEHTPVLAHPEGASLDGEFVFFPQ